MQGSLFEREIDRLSKLRPLRPRQEQAIRSIREAIREGHKRIVVQGPCGFGKTLLSAHIIAAALRKGKRPMFTCPAINLVNQTLKAFEAEGIRDIGVMQAQHVRTNREAAVQIASIQTLILRECPDVDFVIVDECHQEWDKFKELLDSEEWKDKIVIGLSATPWKKGMGLRWTKLIVAATIRELIEEGHLSPFVVYSTRTDPDLSGVKVVKGEYEENALAAVMDQPVLIADAVKTWLEKGEGRPTFLFAVNRAHAKSLQEEFLAAGVSCGYIDAFSTPDDRKDLFRKFRSGEYTVIVSVGCLSTGVDEDVRCVIDCKPKNGEILYVQEWGRGIRPADGKENCIFLDHAGNAVRLGLITDIHHDHLDTRKPSDRGESYKEDYKPAKPKKCQKCYTVIPPGDRKCPSCQERVPLNPRVTVVDGRLVEIGLGPKKDVRERQDWYSGLLWIARRSNRRDGWAAYTYKSRFSEWPKNLRVRGKQPSDEVKKFVRDRQKEYHASKKNTGTNL